MKKTILFAMTLVSIFVLFTACSKEKTTEVTPTSNVHYLTSKKWYLVELNQYPGISDGKGGMITDIFATIKDCDKDNFYNYQTDGTLVDDQGLINCNNIPQITYGTWRLENNETTLVTGDISKFEIISLDENNFKLKFVLIDKNGAVLQTNSYSYISK